jgi:glutaredoxin
LRDQIKAVEFYWRRGCGFCFALDRSLSKRGIPMDKHNIWEEPVAAEFVRTATNGAETVPTIRVGTVTLVNPSPKSVLAAIESEAPHLLPVEEIAESESPGLLARLLGRN